MAKQKSRIKLLQPIAIPWDLAIALAGAGVVKGPTVPKMEAMEKWLVSGGRSLEISHDPETKQVAAIVEAPGADGKRTYTGYGDTMPLATAEAIHAYIKAQPKPDPAGGDLPLFRGNGGVASVAEMGLEADADMETRSGDDGWGEEDANDGDEQSADGDPMDDMLAAVGDEDPELADAFADEADEPDAHPFRFLFVVDPQDVALWRAELPVRQTELGPEPLVVWEEGGEDAEFGRGFYVNPLYRYDPGAGWITERDPVPGESAVVWSRDPVQTAKPAKKRAAAGAAV